MAESANDARIQTQTVRQADTDLTFGAGEDVALAAPFRQHVADDARAFQGPLAGADIAEHVRHGFARPAEIDGPEERARRDRIAVRSSHLVIESCAAEVSKQCGVIDGSDGNVGPIESFRDADRQQRRTESLLERKTETKVHRQRKRRDELAELQRFASHHSTSFQISG